jgi:hypothetical protein
VVVLAILGIVAALTGLTFRTIPDQRMVEPSLARIAEARRAAIQSGHSMTVTLLRDGRAIVATAHADGSILADSSIAVDRLSGRATR